MLTTGVAVGLALVFAQPPAAERNPELYRDAQAFAEYTVLLAGQVVDSFAKPVKVGELYLAGATALYDSAGKKLPAEIRDRLLTADPAEAVNLLVEARVGLGVVEELTGLRAFAVAADGFAKVTDPYCGLMWQRNTSFATSDAEFGLGFELEGVVGAKWIGYLLDVRGGAIPFGGLPVPRAGGVADAPPRPPTGAPWVVRRIVPGGPAARAGLRIGDRITHFAGDEITPAANPSLFRKLVATGLPDFRDPGQPFDVGQKVTVRVQRTGEPKPLDLDLSRSGYTPESIFGVHRRADGTWNCLLDPAARIGYIRVGSVETPATDVYLRILDDLARDGVRGLVLDLRWCPGGFVDPTSRLAAALLPAGKLIASVESKRPERLNQSTYYSDVGPAVGVWATVPVVVLIGPETVGGGEMIAAALQDHGRATLVGQRTFGKANLMNTVATNFPGLMFRVSTGYSLRPNGKPRHRFPDSKPTDPWGVRPDRGFEVPVTADLIAKLRIEAERSATRPAGDLTSLPFDDPLQDPQKMVAVKYLKQIMEGKK